MSIMDFTLFLSISYAIFLVALGIESWWLNR